MFTNEDQMKTALTRIYTLLASPVFSRESGEKGLWKSTFMELIGLVHEVLYWVDLGNKRVDFLDDVGVNGKIQDITSLVDWMHHRLPELTHEKPGQLAGNRLNVYFDQGWGYFANGCFFTVGYDDELAFFVDDQRIYLNRHIRRAMDQVKQL